MVEAHGHAARSDSRACGGSLNAGERAYDRGDAKRPGWLAYLDSAYMSAKAGQCFHDLGENGRAAKLARQSLDMSDGYQRGKVLNLCLLASTLVPKDLIEAVQVGTHALELAGTVESRRTHASLRSVRAQLAPYSEVPGVEEFRGRVATTRRV